MVAYPNETYTLTAVDWGSFGQILQIESSRIDPGVQQILLAANGEVDATFVATMKSSPRIIFSTTDIKGVLDLIGFTGGDIDALSTSQTLKLYFIKRDKMALASGSVHISMAIAQGLIVPRSISAGDGQPARMEVEIIPVDTNPDDANDPVIILNNQAGPTISPADQGVTDAWTIGPWVINGDLMEDGIITSMTIDPGIEINTISGGGSPFPRLAQVMNKRPTLTMQTQQSRVLFDLLVKGVAVSGITRAYLRKLLKGGTTDFDASATAIQFEVSEGMINVDSSSASQSGNADHSVTVTPTFDGTNASVLLDTASVINVA